ncbi:MAG: DUF3558 domain-containing protein [Actinophytocola sp.]|uniref:DUF3558 family protein n=1 Tax=Actinophytocola sp. TaxID=1872138 RepID=UPI00132A21B0|nr:DUF3558 family protein [Actinophytocola sp.]MPZ82933.1 DUF3558 domain-containing protein [Actinophytocola sp.]
MRGTLLAATAVAVMVVVAGCGGDVDTTKVTYTRTTVPAGQANTGGATETGTPRSDDPAFTIDKLRLVEPCELLTEDLLASVGKPADNTRGGFSECSNYMEDADGEDLSITLTLGDSVTNAADADQNIGGLPAMESKLDSGDACFITVVTSTSPNFGLVIQAGGSAKDLCKAGRTVMAGVVEAIRADPPEYDAAKGTLLSVDPCAALDEAALTAALGADDEGAPYNLHWCNWSGESANLGLWFRLGFDPEEGGSDAKPVDLGGGVTGYQEATTSDVASCELQFAHRPFDSEDSEIVHLFYDKSEPAKGEDPCVAPQALAKKLIATLPKP